MDTAEQLLEQLAEEGGEIVSSAACTTEEINEARADGRFYVNQNYLGFVLRRGVAREPVSGTVQPVRGSELEIEEVAPGYVQISRPEERAIPLDSPFGIV